MLGAHRAAPTAGLAHELHQVVTAMEAKPESEAFRAPVDRAKYPKYYEEIKDPIGAGCSEGRGLHLPLTPAAGAPPLLRWRARRPEHD